jgi:hypothetical protein
MPHSASQPNRLLPNQEPATFYPNDEGLLLEGEPKGVAIEVTYCSNQGLSHKLPPISPTLIKRKGHTLPLFPL